MLGYVLFRCNLLYFYIAINNNNVYSWLQKYKKHGPDGLFDGRGRRKGHLRDYFLAYPLKTRQRVKTVTMDMYTPHMDVVQELFPNAKFIIDRFHLVQALNQRLNKLHVAMMNEFRIPNHRLYNKYKNYWRLFLTPRENLDTSHYQPFKLFDWLTNTGGIVEYLLDKNPMLKETYNIVHNLREALQENDSEAFLTQLVHAKLAIVPNWT